MKNFFKAILLILLSFLFISSAIAYDNKLVHPTINEAATIRSGLDLFLKQQLEIREGLDKILNRNKTIRECITEGGKLEDETDCRSKFHFHDPTKSWNSAGLSNVLVDTYCLDYQHHSSLVWAQDADNLWTWQRARQYYFEALTNANKELRDRKLADTLRSLGQIMHLIADSSVPAHTRNDIHVFPYTLPKINITVGDPTYESWAKQNYKNLNYTGVAIDHAIFRQAVFDSSAPVVISALWDQNKYTGTNPDITIASAVGLAEYSNANYFSEDTIFSGFSFPAWSSIDEYDEVIDPSGKIRTYLKKIKDGEIVNHLAAGKWFYKYLPSFLKSSALQLDEKVYTEYASKLVPRAVGYSAGLLNYFFRGTMEAVNPREIEGDGQITGIRFNILNNTQSDSMIPKINPETGQSGSKFLISYEYESAGDEIHNGVSNEQILNEEIASGSESTTEFTFSFPEGIPSDAQYKKYWLVYRGTLGNEEDAVIGRLLPDETLEITQPDQYVYSVIDGSVMPQQFTCIKAKIRSLIALEEVQAGNISAEARYKKRTDYQPDLSTDPPSEQSREPFYSSSVSLPIELTPDDITVLNSSEPIEFTFDFINSPIPAGITDLYFHVVVQGTMNSQSDVTLATGTKDLMEPSHHVFWNLTDMFSLDGHLYTSDQIKANYNLASKVDLDHDGVFNEIVIGEPYIDHLPMTFEIAYMAESETEDPIYSSASVESLPAGSHIRLIVLADRQSNNHLRLAWSDNIDTPSAHFDFTFNGAVNQMDTDGVWMSTPIETFRSGISDEGPQPIRQHFSQGVLRCQPFSFNPETGIYGCTYPEQEALPADLTAYPAAINFP